MTANDVLALLDRLVLGAVDQDVRADLGQLGDMLEEAGFAESARLVRERGEFNGVRTMPDRRCARCGNERGVSLVATRQGGFTSLCRCGQERLVAAVCPNCQCQIP